MIGVSCYYYGISFSNYICISDPLSIDNSDLNLSIDKTDFCSVQAMSHKGFGLCWAGARGTYGATRGKIVYEVSITSNNDTTHLENESCPNALR